MEVEEGREKCATLWLFTICFRSK